MADKKTLLEEKKSTFEELLRLKQEHFEKVRNHQREQLSSINEADLDKSEHLESQTENMMQEMRVENESLDHLEKEINHIKEKRDLKAHTEVGPSSLIKTSFGNFLVAVPLDVFELNGNKYTAISTQSPIYQAMEGKSAGDELEFNGQQIKINEVV